MVKWTLLFKNYYLLYFIFKIVLENNGQILVWIFKNKIILKKIYLKKKKEKTVFKLYHEPKLLLLRRMFTIFRQLSKF